MLPYSVEIALTLWLAWKTADLFGYVGGTLSSMIAFVVIFIPDASRCLCFHLQPGEKQNIHFLSSCTWEISYSYVNERKKYRDFKARGLKNSFMSFQSLLETLCLLRTIIFFSYYRINQNPSTLRCKVQRFMYHNAFTIKNIQKTSLTASCFSVYDSSTALRHSCKLIMPNE